MIRSPTSSSWCCCYSNCCCCCSSVNFPRFIPSPSHQLNTNLTFPPNFHYYFKLSASLSSSSRISKRYGYGGPSIKRQRFLLTIASMDWDMSSFPLDDRADSDGSVGYTFSSSEGEESDGDIILNPITDVDIPTSSERRQPDDSLTTAAQRLAMMGRSRKRSRIKYGILINIGLVTFLTMLLLLLDSHAWRIVRLPLPPFHLIFPFTASAILVSFAGYICVPLFRISKMQMIISKWPARHSSKKGTVTMGGLFLIPIGVVVAEVLVGFSSTEVSGASIATLAFATIGLIDDFLILVKRRKIGLSPWIRILFEVKAITNLYRWQLSLVKWVKPRNLAERATGQMCSKFPIVNVYKVGELLTRTWLGEGARHKFLVTRTCLGVP